jgi:hypothetical protein
MIETERYVKTRAERGFSHNLCPNQPLDCYIKRGLAIQELLTKDHSTPYQVKY